MPERDYIELTSRDGRSLVKDLYRLPGTVAYLGRSGVHRIAAEGLRGRPLVLNKLELSLLVWGCRAGTGESRERGSSAGNQPEG